MGIKAGLQLGKGIIASLSRTSNSKYLFATRPVKIKPAELKFAPELKLEGGIFQIAKRGVRETCRAEALSLIPKSKFKSIKEFQEYLSTLKYPEMDFARYSENEIDEILSFYKENPDLVTYVIGRAKCSGDVYTSGGIEQLLKLHKQYPNEVEKLLIKIKNDEGLYGLSEVKSYITSLERNSELTETLLSQGDRFSLNDIEDIVKRYDLEPQIREMLKAKTIGKDGEEIFAYTGSSFKKSSFDETRQYLMSLKTSSNRKLLSESEIDNLIIQHDGGSRANDIIKFCEENPEYSPILKLLATNLQDLKSYQNSFFYTKNASGNVGINKKMLDFFMKHISGEEGYFTVNTPYLKSFYELNLVNPKGAKNIRFKLNEEGLPCNLEYEKVTNVGKNRKFIEHTFENGSNIRQEIAYTPITDEFGTVIIGKTSKKEYYDTTNNLIYSETITPSSVKPGDFEIVINKNGKKEIVGYVRQYGSQAQGSRVGRKLLSPNGIMTKQVKIEGPKGGGSRYIITDKDGNVMSSTVRRHRKISETHYTSSVNNKNYDIQVTGDTIKVKEIDANGNIINEVSLTNAEIDTEAINLLKKLPGDYLIKLKEMGYQIRRFPKCEEITRSGGAYCAYEDKLIAFSSDLDDPFVLAHEIGHALDYSRINPLNQDSKLLEIFKKELSNYKSISTSEEGHLIDYFTSLDHYSPEGAITEVIAETNALLSGLNCTKSATNMLGLRSVTLQQYFPETVAYITNIIV